MYASLDIVIVKVFDIVDSPTQQLDTFELDIAIAPSRLEAIQRCFSHLPLHKLSEALLYQPLTGHIFSEQEADILTAIGFSVYVPAWLAILMYHLGTKVARLAAPCRKSNCCEYSRLPDTLEDLQRRLHNLLASLHRWFVVDGQGETYLLPEMVAISDEAAAKPLLRFPGKESSTYSLAEIRRHGFAIDTLSDSSTLFFSGSQSHCSTSSLVSESAYSFHGCHYY